MNKLNGFENWIITEAVKQFVEKAERDIDEMHLEGKNPIYGKGYFTMVSKDLLKKVDNNTLKKYIKERDAQNAS